MRLGLVHVNMGSMSTPATLVAAARAAEEAGFDSLWAGEHLVLPDPQAPPSPMDPRAPALDSLLALTWAAAHTTTIRLATGIVILPQRNPVVLAKEVATLDVLSGGRMILGIGAGYLEAEFVAVGANFAERNAVTDEYLDVLESLWYQERPEYHGRFVDFGGIDAHPRPAAVANPAGRGRTSLAFVPPCCRSRRWLVRLLAHPGADGRGERRAARRGRACRPSAAAGQARDQRDAARTADPELVEAFAQQGVDRLVVLAPATVDGASVRSMTPPPPLRRSEPSGEAGPLPRQLCQSLDGRDRTASRGRLVAKRMIAVKCG